MAEVELAKVVDDSPLTVRLKGDTTDTPAQRKVSGLPAVSAGDDVLVVVVDRLVVVTDIVVNA